MDEFACFLLFFVFFCKWKSFDMLLTEIFLSRIKWNSSNSNIKHKQHETTRSASINPLGWLKFLCCHFCIILIKTNGIWSKTTTFLGSWFYQTKLAWSKMFARQHSFDSDCYVFCLACLFYATLPNGSEIYHVHSNESMCFMQFIFFFFELYRAKKSGRQT